MLDIDMALIWSLGQRHRPEIITVMLIYVVTAGPLGGYCFRTAFLHSISCCLARIGNLK